MEHWPQFVYLALTFLNLGIAVAAHGKPREPTNAYAVIIGSAIGISLLIAGGFFKDIFLMQHLPQYIYISFLVAFICAHLVEHGKPRGPTNVLFKIAEAAIITAIVTAGGFFKGVF